MFTEIAADCLTRNPHIILNTYVSTIDLRMISLTLKFSILSNLHVGISDSQFKFVKVYHLHRTSG